MKNGLVPARLKESLNELRRTINNWFDRFLPSQTNRESWLAPESTFFDWFNFGNFPAVDMEETNDEFIVTAELPGLSENDFEVELQGQRLIIRGEKKIQQEKRDRSYYYSECQYGSFSRVIPIPCEIEPDKVEAKYKHGILTVRLPKSESAKAHRIQIKVS